MNISRPFINRPAATTLLTIATALAGGIAYKVLPARRCRRWISPQSQSATLPGASADIAASSIATPLESSLPNAGVTEMTSSSSLGNTAVTLQFDLSRDINGAARDVEAAINSARTLSARQPVGQSDHCKVNPADRPSW